MWPAKRIVFLPAEYCHDQYCHERKPSTPALSEPREIDFESDLEISSRHRRSQIHSRSRSCILPRWLSYSARRIRGRRCIFRDQRIFDHKKNRRGDCTRRLLLPKFLRKPGETAISRSVCHSPGHVLLFPHCCSPQITSSSLLNQPCGLLYLLQTSSFGLNSGYWATDNRLKPLLHTWSLSAEEQFYLFWPLHSIFFRSLRTNLSRQH